MINKRRFFSILVLSVLVTVTLFVFRNNQKATCLADKSDTNDGALQNEEFKNESCKKNEAANQTESIVYVDENKYPVNQAILPESAVILRSKDNDGTSKCVVPPFGTSLILEGRLAQTVNETVDMDNTYFAVRITVWVDEEIMKEAYIYDGVPYSDYKKLNPEDKRASSAFSEWLESKEAAQIRLAVQERERDKLIEAGIIVEDCSENGIDVLLNKKQIESVVPTERCGFGLYWTPALE